VSLAIIVGFCISFVFSIDIRIFLGIVGFFVCWFDLFLLGSDLVLALALILVL